MKTNFRFVISMLALVALFAVSAFAQRTTGDIEGTVTDPSGAVVPNVTVTIVSAQSTGGGAEANVTSGFRRTVQTDSNGYYRVQQVPPGSYLVTTAAISGFGEGRNPNVRVSVDNTTRADVSLGVAGATAQVDISADDAPPIDTGGSKIQSNITSQRIELLPKGVDFTSVLKTVPGTRPEGNAGGVSVDGASGSENAFYIDGQEVTNFRTGTLNGNNAIPTQFVQEVQVKSSGFEAEFGGATGGVISVVTKGGSNDWRGEFGVQFNTPELNGGERPSLVRFTSGSGATFKQSTEYITPFKSKGADFFPTANLSGPIVKDRLWFFGSYSPQYYNTNHVTTYYTNAPAATRKVTATQEYSLERTYEYAFARLDASPTNNLRLTGTYTWNPIIDEGNVPAGTISLGGAPPSVAFGGNIGTLTGNELTSRQGGRQNSNNITAQAVWTPTSKLVVSGRFSRGFLNERLGSYFVPTGTRFICQVGGPELGCSSGFADPANTDIIRDVSIRTNWEVDASYLVSNLAGRHEFKGGYQRFKILNDVDRGYIGPGRVDLYYGYTIEDLGAPFESTGPICEAGQTTDCVIGSGELIRFGTRGKGQNLNQSLYIQDRWQPTSRLTLNLGVRFEKEDLPSFNGLAPPINFGWGDKISPRLGFAYDLTGDGKTKLFAFYGQFYDRLKFELPRGSFGGDFYRVDFFEILPGDGTFRTFTPSRILGSFNDAAGGACPETGFIASGAISRCQFDYRIASNDPNATIFTGAVDPDLKPFRQTEFTAGLERQLSRDYVLKGRYTYKNVDQAVEDAGIRNNEGSEAYIIGNPGQGLHLELLNELGYDRAATPERQYNAVEVQLDKRLSSNYYFNLNYTWSRLYGNYSGLASSDEAGRTSPGVNRFFDLPFIGFTVAGEPDNGLLATDRTHVFNAYGAYVFDWKGSKTNTTEISGFTTFQSGTPVSTTVTYIVPLFLDGRGDMGRTPMFTQTDLAVSHKYRFGRDNRFTFAADLNILNLFDEENVLGYFTSKSAVTMDPSTFDLSEIDGANALTSGSLYGPINTYLQGTSVALNRMDARYGQSNSFQGPRSVRFGFRLLF
jgi:hypothetical protein